MLRKVCVGVCVRGPLLVVTRGRDNVALCGIWSWLKAKALNGDRGIESKSANECSCSNVALYIADSKCGLVNGPLIHASV